MPQGQNLFVVNGKRRLRATCKRCGSTYAHDKGQRRCMTCKRARQRAWQLLNKEKRKLYDHEYYLRTRALCAQYRHEERVNELRKQTG